MADLLAEHKRALAAVDRIAKAEPPPVHWPDPEPLPDGLPKVEPFRAELLPESIRPWVMDIARRMQCPPDYPAVAAMVALSSLIGRKVGIRPKALDSGFEVIPNLWGMLIGRPSAYKTPAMAEALKPLKRLEVEARERYEEAVAQHEVDSQLAEMRREQETKEAKAAMKEGKAELARELLRAAQALDPEPPHRRRFIVNDATVEKLGELLNENPTGLLLERDELSGFLKGLDREDRSNDRAFYLEGFNGSGSYTYDRVGRGTIDIPATCLSIIGTIQPGKLIPYVGNAVRQGMGDDGLMQRFQLAVYPDSVRQWRYRDDLPDGKAKAAAYAVFQRLAQLEPVEPEEGDDLHFTRFTPEAQRLFIDWLTDLEQKIRQPDIHPAIEAHLAKYRSLAPSLALVIQLAEGETLEVSASAFARAAEWCDYLESHARRIYGMAVDNDTANARAILEKVKAGKLPPTFKPRDVLRKGWSGLTDSGAVQGALDVLDEYGWLHAETTRPKTGRPSTVYHVHPSLAGGEA